MKKRLLALCLAAALLLGMMPALTLSTNAAAETVVNKETLDFISANGVGAGYTADPTAVFYRPGYFVFNGYKWTVTAKAVPALAFDHNKEVLYQQTMQFATDGSATVGEITVEKGYLQVSGCMAVTLMDANKGSFLYYCITGSEAGTYQVRFLKEDDTMEDINLGVSGATTITNLGIRWNIDGTVTVLIGEDPKGTTATNVTWTVDPTADPGTKYNPQAQLNATEFTTAYDFVEYNHNNFARINMGDNDNCYITTTEYLPAKLDSYFTAETLTADNALSENSWKYADFETVGGYDAAVLVNKGTAYVALKSATAADDTTVTVKLGGAERTATFANGAAEVEFPGAVTSYDVAAAELTVGTEKATVTFAAKTIDAEATSETVLGQDLLSWQYKHTDMFYTATSSGYGYFRIKTGNVGLLRFNKPVDHTKEHKLDLTGIGYDTSLAAASTGTGEFTSNGYTQSGVLIVVQDQEGKAFYVANLYVASDNTDVVTDNEYMLRFYLPTADGVGVNADPIALGVNPPNKIDLSLVWKTNGKVEVLVGGETKGELDATWEIPASIPSGRTVYSHLQTFDQIVLYRSAVSQTNDLFFVIGGLGVTETTYGSDLNTDLADDLWDAIDAQIDYDNLVYLPPAIEHPYLGNVALDWYSDPDYLVSNGIVNTPSEDVEDAYIWAEVDGELVYEAAGVVVKAAEPVYGAFTSDVNAGWHLVPFTQLKNSADSVAVLATDKDTVYVAVKSASATATVTLGTAEPQEIEIDDGIGYAKFDNVGLSQFGDARDIKVYTDNGTLENKVILDDQINLDKEGATTSKVTFNGTQTEANFVMAGYNRWFDVGAYRLNGSAGKPAYFGTTLDLDHTKQVVVTHCVGLDGNQFVTDPDGEITLSDGVLSYNGILYTLKDSAENGGVVYALAYRYSDNRVGIKFIIPDGNGGITTTEMINYGVFPSTSPYYRVNLIWNVNGSVTVQLVDDNTNIVYDRGTTAQSVTWTHAQVGEIGMPEASEGFRGTVDFKNYDLVKGTEKISQFYLYQCDGGIVVSHSEPVVDIEIPTFYGWNIALGSDIGLNFYLNMHGKTSAMVNVSLAGDPLKTIAASEMELYKEGIYKAEANIAAVQMTEEIKVELSVFGFAIDAQTKTTTVKDYVADAKAQDLFADVEKTLADAMLTYGAAAQNYFGYKTDALASEAPPSNALLGVSVNNADVAGSLTGITAKSATLLLQERVIIRYYFDAQTVEGLVFKLGDEELTPEFHDVKKCWYVDVDVLPQNMDETYTVTVAPVEGEGILSVSYSCMTYLVNMSDSQVANLPALMMAMYDYYAAAEVVASAN